MNAKALLALLAVPAAAQPPSVSLSMRFSSVPSGASGGPVPILMYGDYARVVVDAAFSPPIGTQVTYTAPPGPGVGTIAGLASATFDILGCDAIPATWTLSGNGFAGTTGNTWGLRSSWDFGSAGATQTNGDILNISALQFPAFGANPASPVLELWRGRWDYGVFWAGRWIRLTLYPRDAALLVRYGPNSFDFVTVPAAVSSPASIEIFLDSGPPPPCSPWVTSSPQNTAASTGSAATFHVGAQWFNPSPGCGQFTYQWRRNCQTLVNGGNIFGADTDTLRIDPVTPGSAGQYDVRIIGTHSYAATLTVICYANCDSSTTPPILNVADFSCFLNRFAAGDTYANCDRSTLAPILNISDFSCFLNAFAAGCP